MENKVLQKRGMRGWVICYSANLETIYLTSGNNNEFLKNKLWSDDI